MAQPTTKAEFKEFCFRKLGKPVIEINKSICSVGNDNLKREILDILQIII